MFLEPLHLSCQRTITNRFFLYPIFLLRKKIFYKQTCLYPKEIYVMFVYVTHVITCVGCLSWISGFLFRISLKSKRDLNEFFLFVVALPNSMIKEVVYVRKEVKKIWLPFLLVYFFNVQKSQKYCWGHLTCSEELSQMSTEMTCDWIHCDLIWEKCLW